MSPDFQEGYFIGVILGSFITCIVVLVNQKWKWIRP